MRHQTKEAVQRFRSRHRFITNIGIWVPADETAKVPRPHVQLSGLGRRSNNERFAEFFRLLQGLLVAAHDENRTGRHHGLTTAA
jgi:hypothetical protein